MPAHAVLSGALDDCSSGRDSMRWALQHPWAFLLAPMTFTKEAWELDGAGVSFDRWCAIVTALDADFDPALETQEADALVKRGFVQRTYRLGARP